LFGSWEFSGEEREDFRRRRGTREKTEILLYFFGSVFINAFDE
jgi:hypothetical protein